MLVTCVSGPHWGRSAQGRSAPGPVRTGAGPHRGRSAQGPVRTGAGPHRGRSAPGPVRTGAGPHRGRSAPGPVCTGAGPHRGRSTQGPFHTGAGPHRGRSTPGPVHTGAGPHRAGGSTRTHRCTFRHVHISNIRFKFNFTVSVEAVPDGKLFQGTEFLTQICVFNFYFFTVYSLINKSFSLSTRNPEIYYLEITVQDTR